ncbi:hypothetical protein CHU93_05000 [Sandarakinorhabdus cyanobacteriorum]|uniref:Uncharacterized protein n=1 Tax=Sandarakinorhabdus cyanobacteriorum TaxID=1981098 RepID=A0A255YRB2_9SPHN|nr:hypothetical protein [Sandarakinorhabdus cyanobacteriorum]OYQ31165.1 hypothetical protein CHU93_05000 [Sandarakinorhabdus cyanobacteriorum]
MTTPTPIDRLIRVRRIRERLALADLARAQGQAAADAALLGRVRALVGGQGEGTANAGARAARARIDGQLQAIAADIADRQTRALARRDEASRQLAAARAAVDAALARRAEQESGQ